MKKKVNTKINMAQKDKTITMKKKKYHKYVFLRFKGVFCT